MGCFNFGKGKKTKPNKTVASKKSTNTPSQSKTSTEKSKNSSSSLKPDQPISKSATSTPSTPSRCSIPNLYEQRGQKLQVFDFEELRASTNDFNRALKLGEGGFGTVFKGFLKGRDSTGGRFVVAVKRLKQSSLQVQSLYQ
jgi:hypothetical protein